MSLHFLSSAALCSRKDYFFAFVYTAYLHFFIAEPPVFSTLSLPSVVLSGPENPLPLVIQEKW